MQERSVLVSRERWIDPDVKPGQLEYSREQLLASHAVEEPLVAADVLCHGGFIGGKYCSPRTLVRTPAIQAWKARLASEGHPLLYFPTNYVPPQYPNYLQTKLLLEEGVRDPVVRALTNVAIVEGFGARIRSVGALELERHLLEDIGGTALAHLEGGLFEAHARDEAGWRSEGGHKQMWEAARDLGLDRPRVPDDVLLQLLMNLDTGKLKATSQRLVPEISKTLETLIGLMATVMVVEIFASEMFIWAKQLFGDPEISSRPREALQMIRYIEADEESHIEYLRTALSEIRARTVLSEDGKQQLRGADVVDRIVAAQLQGVASARPRQQRAQSRDEIHQLLAERPMGSELRRRYENLDSGWVYPEGEVELQLKMHGAL
jgi:hypothetical protein